MAERRYLTDDQIATRRKLASTMLAKGQEENPIGHWAQGLNRALNSTLGGYEMSQADKMASEKVAQDKATDRKSVV